MSLKDLSNSSGSGGQTSTLQMMQKPPPPPSRANALVMPKQKTSEKGQSSISYLLAGAASLLLVGGLIYFGYELTKPTKKSRPYKVAGKEKNKTKEDSKVKNPIKSLSTNAPTPSDRHEVSFERKPDQEVGILLCPGEDDQPGAFVAANTANKNLGLEIGSQLIEINGRVLDSGMSCKDIAELLAKSCSPTGKLCFKKNQTLGERWKEAEATKDIGNTHYKKKEIDAAITKYSTAIEIHPTNIFYYSNKVNALYSKAKANPENAKEIYAEALCLCETMQQFDVLQNFKKGHHIQGVILFELCRYEEAKKAFETYLQIDNTNEKIRSRLEACENAIAASVQANVGEHKVPDKAPSQPSDGKDGEDEIVLNLTYADVTKLPAKQSQNESPSPVLVEKPSPAGVTEVEPLVGTEQQEAEVKEQAPEKKPTDETSVEASEPAEEKKGDSTKSPKEGGNGSIIAQKD